MSISKKLFTGFFAVLVLLGVLAGVSYYQLTSITSKYSYLVGEQVNKVKGANEMKYLVTKQMRDVRGYLLSGDEAQKKKYTIARDDFDKVETQLAVLLILPKPQQLLKEIGQLHEEYDKVAQQLFIYKKQNNIDAYVQLLKEKGTPIGSDLATKAKEVEQLTLDVLAKDSASTAALAAQVKIVILVVSIAALLIGVAIAFYISRIISRPVKAVAAAAKEIAHGNLAIDNVEVKNRDELGAMAAAFNQMKENLRDVILKVSSNAQQVAAASQEISASTEEIANGSNAQASAAQTMNDLFTELSTAINSVAHSAEQAAELSNSTMNIAKEGGKVVRTSIDGMSIVNEQMSRLEEDSNKIGDIIEVIDDIAAQTNLLALNAAIEAARAGEQGRGFAVVADEVRKLAERSGEATKQITTIIKGMQQNTQNSVKSVGEGVVSSKKTGEAFDNIILMIDQTANKVTEIAAASEEQAAQSSEVFVSIESISAATEEAAATSEQSAATAQSLARMAEDLNNAVATFKIK